MTRRLSRITTIEKAQSAPERWQEQYSHSSHRRDPDKARITQKLLALPAHERTPVRVDQIIGNSSWTRIFCDVCDESVAAATVVSSCSGYHTAQVCDACWTTHALTIRGKDTCK